MNSPRVRSLGPSVLALLAALLGGCSDDPPAATSTSSSSGGSETTAPPPATGTSTSAGASTSASSSDTDPADGTSTSGRPASTTDASTGSATTGTSGGESTGSIPEPGTCCSPQDAPGCAEDPALEACVCGIDPFCCDTWWDELCIETGRSDCGLECSMGCCEAHSQPGCDDPGIADCVCGFDDSCCDTWWDEGCVTGAQYLCSAACGLPPANMGDCCMPQPAPGCADVPVTECVCALDASCCIAPWDEGCIQTAVSACGIECEGYEPIDPCCYVQPGPYCGNMVVETCVCAFDPFCCDVQWDGICVGGAQNECMLDCTGAA